MNNQDQSNLPPDEVTLLAYERTRLASERTFLSWIRTGLTGIGIGLAIAKFRLFERPYYQQIATHMGQLLIFWGITIFIFALISYRHSYKKLEISGEYRSSLMGVTLLTLFLILISILLFWITA